MALDLAALQRRLMGQKDPRSNAGILSRGSNVYKGASTRAHAGGGSQFGAPTKVNPSDALTRLRGNRQQTQSSSPLKGDRKFQPVQQMHPDAQAQSQITPQSQQQAFSFSFNPHFEAAMRRIQGGIAGIDSTEELTRRRIEEQATEQARQLEQQREQNLTTNMENMADRGLVRSGINVGQQAEIGENYQQSIGQLSTEKARTLEDLARQMAGQRQALEDQRQSLEFDRARQEMEIRREEAQRQAQAEAARQQADAIRQQIEALFPQPTPTGQYSPSTGNVNDVQRLEQQYQQAVAAAQAHLQQTGKNDPKLVEAAKTARQQRNAARK